MNRAAILAVLAALLLGACEDDKDPAGFKGLARQVAKQKVGYGTDQWVEMRNLSGEWERVGLIFGYVDDFEECEKAAAGLRSANEAREYRCVPAQAS